MKKILLLSINLIYFAIQICNSQTLKLTYDGSGNRIRQVKAGTMPIPMVSASSTVLQAGQNATLQASNCGGIINWSNAKTGISQIISPSQTNTYFAKCNQGGCISQSNKVTIQTANTSPCNQFLNVLEDVAASQNAKFIANQRVTGKSILFSNATVDFSAGNNIDLKPGFESTSGNFRAFIEPCTIAPTAGMVAYYPFNGNAKDESGNNNHGTPNGPELVTDRYGNLNSAYQFDGINDFINTPVYQNNIISYTVSFWVKVIADGNNNNRVILQARGNSVAGQRSVIVYHSNGGNNWHVAMDGDVFKGVSTNTLQINNEWVHVVGVWDSPENIEVIPNQFKLFINGQQMATTENNFSSGAFPPISGAIQTVLGYHQAWNQYFKGVLDDMRIYDRALSNTEIQQLYSAESNSSTFSNRGLLIHLPFDGNELDISGNGRNAVLPTSGVTFTTDRFGIANKAYSFNGTSSMTVGSWSQLTGNAARTVSVWFKSNSIAKNNILISWGGANTNLLASLGHLIFSGTQFFGYFGYANDVIINTSPYLNNQWHQMTFTHDGALAKLYVDGTLIKSENRTFNTSASALKIGSNFNDIDFLTGSLDEVRIYNRDLNEQEVKSLYQIESNNTNLIAQYPLDGLINDISENNYAGVNYGATPTTDRFGKVGRAMQFNGTSSYIEVQPLQERSLSFWINPDIQEQMQIFSGGGFSADVAYQVGIFKPGGFSQTGFTPTTFGLLLNFYANDIVVPYDQIKSGWHHVVVSWDGITSVKIVLDGNIYPGFVSNGTAFSPQNTQPFILARKPKPNVTQPTYIGKGLSGPWNLYRAFWQGKIDDFRIFNRALTDIEIQAIRNGVL